jgi:hypothetical protein
MPADGLDRPQMVLLDYQPIAGAGALLGRAKVRLPIGLEIAEIGIFKKDGRKWAQLPSEMLRDYQTGQPIKDDRSGKPKYRSTSRWATRELQEGWSEKLIALIEARYGAIGGEAPT